MKKSDYQHPFSQYIQTLGRGKKGTRPLSMDEAYGAMRMILNDQVEPEQLGAFLMLIRIKEESPEELAGFVRSARESLILPGKLPRADLDWSTYAGKRRHLPWFVLVAQLLAENGIKIFMHGTRGFKDDRTYTPGVIDLLGIKQCKNFDDVATQIERYNFAFMQLEDICPKLKRIMELRKLFGLRSPINTLLRMLNPLGAKYLLQGVFHPGYTQIHQQAAAPLKQPHMAVFKGEGGEIERNPDSTCHVFSSHDGVLEDEIWPAMFNARHLKNMEMNTGQLIELWQGKIEDDYGTAAVTGTTAIALRLLGRATNQQDALVNSLDMWKKRDKTRF